MDYQSGLGRHRDPWREEEEHELRAQDLADKKNAALQKKEASQQIQPKLSNNADSIISPDDASEKEADAVSQKVTEGKTVDLSGISGSSGNPVSPKSNGAETPSLPDGFNEKMNQSSGSPMDDSTKTEMESKMGTDFSGVKIHSDSTSHHLAQSINAKAFTHGQDIYFGQGHSAENQGLLAHELVHTVQQGNGISRMIQRTHDHGPDANLTSQWSNVVNNAQVGFFNQFANFVGSNTTSTRWQADPNEEDAAGRAVLQKIQQKTGNAVDPSAVTNTEAGVVVFNFTPTGNTSAKTLTYTYTLTPATPKPKLTITFSSESTGQTAGTQLTPTVQVANTSTSHGYTFPGSLIENSTLPSGYSATHPDSKIKLENYFITKLNARTSFNDYINVGNTTTPDYFFGSFQINASGSYSGNFYYIGSNLGKVMDDPTKNQTFKEMNYGKYILEQDKNLTSGDKINIISGIGDLAGETPLPEDERASLYYMIHSYFKAGDRDTEIDLVLPMPQGHEAVYYTIRYKPAGTNLVDVDVQRIGKQSEISGNSSIDFQYDIAQIKGYDSASGSKDSLTTWLLARYKGLTAADISTPANDRNPVATIRTKMHNLIKAGAGTKEWYNNHYNIKILSKGDAEKKIQELNQNTPLTSNQSQNVKEYSSAQDLEKIEIALHKLSNTVLAAYSGLFFCRETKDLTAPSGSDGASALTSQLINSQGVNTSDVLISVYDRAMIFDQLTFSGGKTGNKSSVTLSSSNSILHEMGHAVQAKIDPVSGNNKTYIQEFDAYMATIQETPFTFYSQSDHGEFFPEAFSLYHSDPEWLKKDHPKIFAWFDARFK